MRATDGHKNKNVPLKAAREAVVGSRLAAEMVLASDFFKREPGGPGAPEGREGRALGAPTAGSAPEAPLRRFKVPRGEYGPLGFDEPFPVQQPPPNGFSPPAITPQIAPGSDSANCEYWSGWGDLSAFTLASASSDHFEPL
ncbi:hypothetical protein T492DRAFT_441723 [Pavlovales sp. CCMP2436]|nr:hypothetical protein T492DRAFT_441723 [Pavlovales sp. CCMP2436]